jgi:hypothetical protein
MVSEERTEFGSDFHLLDEASAEVAPAWWRDGAFFGSGRDAMRTLFAWGAHEHGWKRIWLPSFYCQDVPAALRELGARGVELLAYSDSPDREEPQLSSVRPRSGDVVVIVNHFGARRAPHDLDALARQTTIVEDHSHDLVAPWALGSTAHFAVASLRKTLPLPDGGIAWSPRGLALPPEPALTHAHAAAALSRLSAMVLKRRYLAGLPVDKESFRAQAVHGEEHIADGGPSGIAPLSRAMLPSLPLLAWRQRRRANHEALVAELGALRGVRVLPSAAGTVPFALTLVFEDATRRDDVKRALVLARVYPAILWPLDDPKIDGIPPEHVALARRIMSVHCDQRYTPADMQRVARILKPLVGA